MMTVALTGGIATGKSYVLDRFRRLGADGLDADLLAHGVMAAGTHATQAIAERFGPDVLGDDGAVDRRKLGPIVFGDARARHDLELIVHPAVYRAIQAGLRACQLAGGSAVAVVDIPLLFETGRQADFDKVVATVCPRAMQLARLIERGLSELAANARLAAQLPAEEKAARADFAIDTSGTFEKTDARVQEVWSLLIR
jgi:dephospho-CoA kinase